MRGRLTTVRKNKISLNRLSGLIVAILGAVLVFWVIPQHTETADFGWLRPAALPYITAVIVILSSLVQLAFPTGKAEFDRTLALRAGLFFVISLAGLLLMHLVGFLVAAPVLVLVVMIIIGERRLLWLTAGIVLIPAAIWCAVELLLDWPLP